MIENRATTLLCFLKRAEASWFTVYDSSLGRKTIIYRGNEYIQLPLRYSTKAKIFAYFRKYWSVAFSKRLLCNLKPIVYKGRVYVVLGDPGPVASIVESARIVRSSNTCLIVRAVVSGDSDGKVVIYYKLVRTANGYRIVGRTGIKFDYRYTPCKS